jgi:hypothetical protein
MMSQLQRAQFQRLKPDGTLDSSYEPLPVQYNPKEFTLNKGAQIAETNIPGLDAPILQFVRGQTETLSLELFFDTTDEGMGAGASSVTSLTDEFYRLVKIDSTTHAPPILLFTWGQQFPGQRLYGAVAGASQGNQQRFGFRCVVESVQQRYTLFSPEGVPLRATLTVALKEYKALATQLRELNLQSADHFRAHVVQHGETLSRIAWQTYDNPAEWRRIAQHNSIDDPIALFPGQILEIPPLDMDLKED